MKRVSIIIHCLAVVVVILGMCTSSFAGKCTDMRRAADAYYQKQRVRTHQIAHYEGLIERADQNYRRHRMSKSARDMEIKGFNNKIKGYERDIRNCSDRIEDLAKRIFQECK